mgnify:CR=1 FL=1
MTTLREAVAGLTRRLVRPVPPRPPTPDVQPCCAYELVTRQMLEDMRAELKARLNGLLFMLAGAILLDLILRLVRPG